MVRLSDAPVMVIEGDEYLSSALDMRPKFHLYKPHLAILSGIAWDHINVFPTFENYVEQFNIFIDTMQDEGFVYYAAKDAHLSELFKEYRSGLSVYAYEEFSHKMTNAGVSLLDSQGKEHPMMLFGNHNLQNISAAACICHQLGVSETDFIKHIVSFTGAGRRLELVSESPNCKVYRDFAHSPSKVKATVEAVRMRYPSYGIVACLELHTFSSLNEEFLKEYADTLSEANFPVVYYNPRVIEHKRLKGFSADDVKAAFGDERIQVFTDSALLAEFLLQHDARPAIFLLMSSGHFDGIDLKKLSAVLTV
jgi:UDP-N-acetylmuramate: L-alanyl-gamma-D-glutamyl-meso-diaminopimelate ligase